MERHVVSKVKSNLLTWGNISQIKEQMCFFTLNAKGFNAAKYQYSIAQIPYYSFLVFLALFFLIF